MSSTNSDGAIALEAVLPDTFRENLAKTDKIIDATSDLEPNGEEALGPNKQWQKLLTGMHDRSQTPMASKLHPNQSNLLELSQIKNQKRLASTFYDRFVIKPNQNNSMSRAQQRHLVSKNRSNST